MFKMLRNLNKRGVAKQTEGILAALVVVIISLALLPTVRTFVTDAQNGSTASESALLALVTLFWVLATIGIVVALVRNSMKGK